MKYDYWFANVKGIRCRRKIQLYAQAGSAQALYYIEETKLKEWGCPNEERHTILESIKNWELESEFQKLQRKNVRCVPITNAEYPNRLSAIPTPPYAIYVKGKLPDEDVKTAAIVGARECSPYGKAMAKEYAVALAKAGVQIISGMARGVDSISQTWALESGGSSYAVLGNGVDICYPRESIELYMRLQEQGGLISEQPLGMQPLPQFFPARNRLISGLADLVLVIEAKEKSGSLITADMALEQGRDVYALPGPATSALSMGCHNLIRQGAGILISPQELFNELGIFIGENQKNATENKNVLDMSENLLYSCLSFQPKSLNRLFEETKFPIPKLLQALTGLELKGYIQEISKNYYAKVKQ